MDEIGCKVRVDINGGQGETLTLEDSEAKGINSLNTQSAKDAALSNPVILDKIIDYLKSPKTLRLVSKDWNDAVLSGQPRLTLNLNLMSDVESLSEWDTLLETLNPKLCKRIILHDAKVGESQNAGLNPDKLFLICEKYGTHITRFSVTWWLEIVNTLIEILYSDSCPNITHLTISIIARESPHNPDTTMPKNFNRNIQIKSKLTRFKILWWGRDTTLSSWSHIIYTFLSNLLAAAPNLLHVDIDSSVCPSLERNIKLKSLRFNSVYNELLNPNDSGFNLAHLSGILDQVKNSLETLSVNTFLGHVDCGGCDLSFSRHFQLPIMPKLVSFQSKYRTMARVHGVLRPLWINRMPSLTSLSIDFYDTHPWTQRIESLPNILKIGNCNGAPMRNIRSVSLHSLDGADSQLVSQLKWPFPGLTRLSLFLTPVDTRSGDETIPHNEWMGQVLKSCSTLGLRHLYVKTESSYQISRIVDLLWDCRNELISGLNSLVISNQDPSSTEASDDLTTDTWAKFKELLIMTKNMKSLRLHGFLFGVEQMKKILDYVEDNKLPVRFTG